MPFFFAQYSKFVYYILGEKIQTDTLIDSIISVLYIYIYVV